MSLCTDLKLPGNDKYDATKFPKNQMPKEIIERRKMFSGRS
jgi:hypothetical protein